MFGSSILEVAIGMVFIYLLMSLICSAVNEIAEAWFKNRATDLERGIRELFNQEGGRGLVEQFYRHPLISGLYNGVYERAGDEPVGRMDFWTRTNLPAYIPARNFSQAVLDLLLHPPAEAEVGRDDPAAGAEGDAPPAVGASALPVTMDAVRAAVRRWGFGRTQTGRALRTLAEQSGEDVNALRENVEAWFNSGMDRVSGHYKRRTKWIIFFIGFAFTILLNVNSITIARRLSTDATLRNMLVAEAEAFSKRDDALKPNLEENRKQLESLGLPIGWPGGIDWISPVGPKFNAWDHVILPFLGWLLTAAAISLGAPFWFDLLNKFMVIRSTVKPHEKSKEEGSEDRQDRKTTNLTLAALGTALGARAPAAQPAASASASARTSAAEAEPPPTPEPEPAAQPDEEDNESDFDGCDLEAEEDEKTKDEDLPPSEGGVA
ncbi:MAG TPA: hypothetical protein VGX48_09555 [Pyrinomonadaceae bacterium]|jgi:hypothetical protein|nr:hypothetical protein [Pyrinomonadaceae bacterium]